MKLLPNIYHYVHHVCVMRSQKRKEGSEDGSGTEGNALDAQQQASLEGLLFCTSLAELS